MQRSLIEALIPSFPAVRDIIATIRERYHIDEVLPEDRKMARIVKAQLTADEWAEVLVDIEEELRGQVKPFTPELEAAFSTLVLVVTEARKLGGLEGAKLEVADPSLAKLIATMSEDVGETIHYLDQFYSISAQRLLDYIRTGKPIQVPGVWFNILGVATIEHEDDNDKFVIAVAHEWTDPDEFIAKLRQQMIKAFGDRPKITADQLEEVEYLVKKSTGRTIEQVVELFLERNPDKIPYDSGTEEYEEHKSTLVNSTKVSLWRLKQRVETIVRYKME